MPDVYVAPQAKLPIRVDNLTLNPIGLNFETRDDTEEVVLLLRRHVITNIPWIIIAIIMLFAPLVLSFFPLLSFLPLRFQFMATIIWYLLTTAFIFENFLSWYFNVYLVTNERIIDYDFFNLLYKNTSDAELNKIQDINVQMGGLSQTLFNYGTVLIETAGEIPNLEFDLVPNPAYVVKVIRELEDQIPPGGNL
ncbi:hypothetical protein COT44_03570 [Candidatus Shapirobacteria bacterium CG08_land_8_20_14_0_20_39_18]|uniref:DUF304 domain-containing protein n=1 Tax=Candidatus Shapirobacteria bacterium CG08_land_8_20_14_0_20_39_18 TaxID=1974883 RepID=A0A2M6XCT9_9BACT|nr:MAG: hypothetical protein COT44_03570 [Candidatus Shapirobacteria bacterium CG08_land_8_20_14_0_20_39_18]PIY65140.1 MAG: hypothetical protein COY91_03680 [Candidatus Shapirobacteria bacterium CG_4_10_14_0_8_um_filter_39_15]PJE67997.1 MAG: hypothetical protein COU94_04115 [Candidatus Shapirobacteria bacterium CG10_big_fil_rev_8_21_14_0_10_38_8]